MYSWFATMTCRPRSPRSGSRERKSLLYPNWPAWAFAVCLSGLKAGAPRRIGSPQRITTFWAYPSGMVTLSSLLGATGENRRPRAPDGAGLWGWPGWCPCPASATASACGALGPVRAAVPAAVATVTTAAARIIERRDTAPAMMSPAYSLSLVLGVSLKQASPQRKRQVSAERPPGCELMNGSRLRTWIPSVWCRA
ncbi:hypothetical protein SGRI78S_05154 [Streptomyces griseus subsp. griseus]